MNSVALNSIQLMEEIISRCQVCHLAMSDSEGKPYVVPMNFGYCDGIVYMHSAPEGKKVAILRKNPEVCIAFSTDYELRYQSEQVACSWGMKYRSVVLQGKVEFVEDYDEKVKALNHIMAQYSKREFVYSAPSVKGVCVFIAKALKIEGRTYGY